MSDRLSVEKMDGAPVCRDNERNMTNSTDASQSLSAEGGLLQSGVNAENSASASSFTDLILESGESTPQEIRLAAAKGNVQRTIVINFMFVLGSVVAFGPTFDKYLLQLSNSNTVVGFAESISGFTSLIVLWPVALWVDHKAKKGIEEHMTC